MGFLGNKEIMGENIKRYMKMHNITRQQLSTVLGVPYTTVIDWINANTYPRIDKIEMMANYFKIQKSDLVEKSVTNLGDELTPKQQELSNLFSSLTEDERKATLEYIAFVKSKRKK